MHIFKLMQNGIKICQLDTTHQPLVKQCNIRSRILLVPVVTRLFPAFLIRHYVLLTTLQAITHGSIFPSAVPICCMRIGCIK